MKPKEDKCVYCEINGMKRPRIGVYEVSDQLTGSKIKVCKQHRDEFYELNSFFENLEEDEAS